MKSGRDRQSVDASIVKLVQQGDKLAFDLLVRRYQFKVSNLISRYVYDQSEIEDIAQEVFVKAYRAINGFRGESAFYTWLYRIAINTAKNYLVAQSRRPPNTDIEASDAELTESGRNLRDIGTPESDLLSRELADRISEALEELPDDLRTALTLRELEGLSYDEIAAAMDCPIGTVRSRIFRAREAIDKQLRPLLK